MINRTLEKMLANGPLLFDGAMGTLYASRSRSPEGDCEAAVLSHPQEILSIHREYIAAGAQAIKTDTFSLPALLAEGKPVEALLSAAVQLALEAADGKAVVFADLGPVHADANSSAASIYCRMAELFLKEGISSFLLETLSDDDGLSELSDYLRASAPDACLIVSFAVGNDGVTRSGHSARALIRKVAALKAVSAVGMNCVCGPGHMLRLISSIDTAGKPLSVMPNAGYPTVIGRHTMYQGQPDYFALRMTELAKAGAQILGGCCGTTPAHIARMCAEVQKLSAAPSPLAASAVSQQLTPEEKPLFWQKLERGEKIIAVEMDPPKNDDLAGFMEDAAAIHDAGADLITLADCPVGRPRADSSLLACKLHREIGLDVLPHMTCRDRNLNATKALLLGLSMEGVHQVLLVTGDPIPSEDRDAVRSVFSFNSRGLASYISELNETTLRHPFRLFGALNVNAVNFNVQLRLAKEKEAHGVTAFLTQPVLSHAALENLNRARQELNGKILGGIYPLVSHRNALFMANEIAGIRIDPEIISRYEGKDREESERIAQELSVSIARQILPFCDGLYLMMPFRRTGLIANILQELQG